MPQPRLLGVGLATGIAVLLGACTSGAPSTRSTPPETSGATWTYSEPSLGVQYGAAWSPDGSRLILIWASDGCGPRLEPISVVTPTKLSIGIATTDRSCTAVEKPFVGASAVPGGVDQSQPVDVMLPDGSTVVPPLPE